MRIDSHQHFWHYDPPEYGWMGPGMEVLRKDYLPGDLLPLLETIRFDGTVAVQARQCLAETEWLLELADRHTFIRGVVGWVDLCHPQVGEQLAEFATHPRLCGVRHVLEDEPDDRFMLRPDFVRGIEILGAFDLAYDILVRPRHLGAACELVQRFPRQRFVLDHVAKPPIEAGIVEPWASEIRRLASFPNVCCKLSGMVTEAGWVSWRLTSFLPYVDVVFDAFGPDRLMIGSDWPVCTVAGTYGEVMQIVLDYVGRLSEPEESAILGDNACNFYKLDCAPLRG